MSVTKKSLELDEFSMGVHYIDGGGPQTYSLKVNVILTLHKSTAKKENHRPISLAIDAKITMTFWRSMFWNTYRLSCNITKLISLRGATYVNQ